LTLFKTPKAVVDCEVVGLGPPIVLIPPAMVGQTVFDNLTQLLCQDFQVIRFELPGHGGSSVWRHQLAFADIAKQIAAVLDQLNIDRAIVLGYSIGASIALEFAHQFPNRTAAVVSVGPFSKVTGFLRAGLIAARSTTKISPQTLALAFAIGNADGPRSVRPMFAAGLHSDYPTVWEIFGAALRFDCRAYLRRISAPVCLVYGTRDIYTGIYQNFIHGSLPNNSFIHIAKAGHQIPPRYYQQLNQVVRSFVAERSILT